MSFIKLPSIILLALAIPLFSGCGDDNASNVDTSPTVPAAAATTLGVQAVDANTGQPIADSTLTITTNADKFNETTAAAANGFATFTVQDGNDPTATPINVSVKASANGFLDSNKSTTITSTGATDLQIELVSTAAGAQPTGVGVSQQAATSNNDGTPTAPINAQANSAASNNGAQQESASISVGTNVSMTDANGQPVTGNLTVSMAYLDADSNDALESFPGGFTVAVDNAAAAQAANDPGTTGQIGDDNQLTFISGGFASIQITSDNGSKVKNFSQPVPVSITISEGTVNPDTGNPVQVGEDLPIWSFDEDTGKWTYERQGTVADANPADGLFEVTFNTTHLSYFNLDWYRSGTRRCTGRIDVLDDTGNAYVSFARVRIANTSGNSRRITYRGDGFIQLFGLLRNIKTIATFTDPSSGEVLGTIGENLPDLCGTNQVTLTPPTLIETNLTVNTSTFCSNNSAEPVLPLPSTYVLLFQDSPSFAYIGSGYTNVSGQVTFNNLIVQSGETTPTYTVAARDSVNGTVRVLTRQTFAEGSDTVNFRFPQTCDLPPTTGAGG